MQQISILIPSRLDSVPVSAAQSLSHAPVRLFVERAIESIRSQTIAGSVNFQIVVGVDAGANIPPALAARSEIKIAESGSRSQASALNAAAKFIKGDIVAILEDDDQWESSFLELAIAALAKADFVSSTQLEVTTDDVVVRVNDFPAPSGWVMKRKTWELVGGFDEKFRWHLDNDWLGRLAEKGASRAHLVEATAPIDPLFVQDMRPWLANCVRLGGSSVQLVRHDQPWPLVKRLVHPESGMQKIARHAAFFAQSEAEQDALMQRFGRVPW